MSVKLYLVHLPQQPLSPEVHTALTALLPLETQARVKRFRLPEDALRCTVGALAPTWYLRHEGLLPGQGVEYGRTSKNKPFLRGPELDVPFAFNISHDGPFVLLGITHAPGAELGVDIMRVPNTQDGREIEEAVSDQLCRSEREALSLCATEERAEMVTRLWTTKEAYVKAIGEGLGFSLDRIEVVMEDGAVRGISVDGRDVREDGWGWASGTQSDGYCWAACSSGAAGIGEVQHVEWDSFVNGLLAPLPPPTPPS